MADAAQKTDWSRQTVNFTPELAEQAEARWRRLGLVSWTEYITWLVSGDLRERPMVVRTEDGVVFATHFTNTPKQETETTANVPRKKRRSMASTTPPPLRSLEKREAGSLDKTPQADHEERAGGGEGSSK